MEDNPFDIYAPTKPIDKLLAATQSDLAIAMERAEMGITSTLHHLDNTVVFILDNHQEVILRVRKIDLQIVDGQIYQMDVHCRADFENVLILAQKLNMRISAFATHFTVILSASPEFIGAWSEQMLDLDHPAKFFETLDELKRPIFLNLNHYVISRISD